MTKQENKIPIKGYNSWDPLKHVWIGSGFKSEWIQHLVKNQKIYDPLCRIADETEEDYQKLDSILKQAGVQTHRTWLDIDKYDTAEHMGRHKPPMTPRDLFATVGDKFHVGGGADTFRGYLGMLNHIDRKDIQMDPLAPFAVSTATLVRVGKDLWWDLRNTQKDTDEKRAFIQKMTTLWESKGFRVHYTSRGYHSDGCFSIVKPGAIVSLHDVQNYKEDFPGWEVCYLPDQSWNLLSPFLDIKEKVDGKWWVQGQEKNDDLTHFINTWLNDWVGYVEETVFDVNMLSIDENHVIVSSYNKTVFDFLKKHKVEPIICDWRHKYFWDGGIHCITQDFYREGEMEDYFG